MKTMITHRARSKKTGEILELAITYTDEQLIENYEWLTPIVDQAKERLKAKTGMPICPFLDESNQQCLDGDGGICIQCTQKQAKVQPIVGNQVSITKPYNKEETK